MINKVPEVITFWRNQAQRKQNLRTHRTGSQVVTNVVATILWRVNDSLGEGVSFKLKYIIDNLQPKDTCQH